jgi:hypothetical protein
MKTKKLTKHFAQKYKEAKTKKEKSMILDEFTELTEYNRSYASWLLRNCGKKVIVKTRTGERLILVGDINRKIKRNRQKTYDSKVQKVLKKVWAIMDYPCGKRLAPMLPKIIPKLIEFGEITIDNETKEKLMNISPATIDLYYRKRRKKERSNASQEPNQEHF